MKNVMLSVALLAAFVLVGCEKENDKESEPDYVGVWETAEYPSVDPMSQRAIQQKIKFTFEASDFEALVYNTDTNDVFNVALGVRGDIAVSGNTSMNVELMEVGLNATGQITWFSKEDSNEKPYFDQYIGLVSTTIPEKFDATYTIEGDKFDIVIPEANDTIHLFKK